MAGYAVSERARSKARSFGLKEAVCTDLQILQQAIRSETVGLDALLEINALAANHAAVQLLLREIEKKKLLLSPETLQEAVRAYPEYRADPAKKAAVLKIVQAIAARMDDLGEDFETSKAFVRTHCPETSTVERSQLASAIDAGMRGEQPVLSPQRASQRELRGRDQQSRGVSTATAVLVAAAAVVLAILFVFYSSKGNGGSAPEPPTATPQPAASRRAEPPPPPPVARARVEADAQAAPAVAVPAPPTHAPAEERHPAGGEQAASAARADEPDKAPGLVGKVFSALGAGSAAPGAAPAASKRRAAGQGGGGSGGSSSPDAGAVKAPEWPPQRTPKQLAEHEGVLEQLGLKAEVTELRARRKDVQDASKLAAARAKEAAAARKAADAADAAAAAARKKEADAASRSDFLAADKHKTEAMEKDKAASRLRAEADTLTDRQSKAEGDETSRRRRLTETEGVVEAQGVAAAEFRLVQLQMRIYDLEFNLAHAKGVDYKGAARFHDELALVRKEKDALLRHFDIFVDPDEVLRTRNSASRARLEMLPAAVKDRAEVAAAGAGGKQSKGKSSSSFLSSLSSIGGGWRRRAGAEAVSAGRDEDKWLPYLGLEKELTDLKVRRKAAAEAVAAAAAVEKRERQAAQRLTELEEAVGNARANLDAAKGRDDVAQAKKYHGLAQESAAALRLAESEATSVRAELQSAQDEAYARATALASLEQSLEAQERTLSKAKGRQLSETLRVASEGYRHALERDDLEQAEALQKQMAKAKAERDALEAVYAQLWRSAPPEQPAGAGSGEAAEGDEQQQQALAAAEEEEGDIVLVQPEIAVSIAAAGSASASGGEAA